MLRARKTELNGMGDVTYGPSLEQLGIPDFGTPSASSGFDWGNLLNTGVNTGLSILKDVYGGPQPGTYIKTPQGGIYQRLPEGSAQAQFSTFPSEFGSGWLVWILVGVGGFLLVKSAISKRD